jgi:hypothetical protein
LCIRPPPWIESGAEDHQVRTATPDHVRLYLQDRALQRQRTGNARLRGRIIIPPADNAASPTAHFCGRPQRG